MAADGKNPRSAAGSGATDSSLGIQHGADVTLEPIAGEIVDPAETAFNAAPDVLAAPESIRQELAVAQELAKNSLAAGTRANYKSQFDAFRRWADARRMSWLPAAVDTVAAHLAEVAVAQDEHGNELRDEYGNLVQGLHPDSVGMRLAAINKAHRVAGYPAPGDDDAIKTLMAGIRRTFGTAHDRARLAAVGPILKRLVASAGDVTRTTLMRRAMVLLAETTGATPGQLSKLGWNNILIGDTATTVTLPAATAHGDPVKIVLQPSDDPNECVARALSSLCEATETDGAVFTREDGKPLTREAIRLNLRKYDGWRDNAQLREQLEGRGEFDLTATRNIAVLLTGWFAALRRSNIVALRWNDLKRGPNGDWELIVRRSKTDQEGKGRTLLLPRTTHGGICPARAMDAWREAVDQEFGEAPQKTWPVFFPINRHGHPALRRGVPQAMSGAAINELVQTLARRAGLAEPEAYGAHSLRAGFVTEGLSRGGLSVAQVQEVTGHKSAQVLLQYYRKANLRRDNPATKVAESLNL